MPKKPTGNSFSVRHVEGETLVYLAARQPGGPIWYRFSVRNRQTWRSAKTTQERLAREQARKAVCEAVEARAGGMPIKASIAAYLDAKHPLKPEGDDKDRREIKRVLGRFAAKYPALDLRADGEQGLRVAIRAYLQGLTHAPRTISNVQLALSGWLGWVLLKHGPDGTRELSWAANPAKRKGLGLPKVRGTPKPPLDPAHVTKLLKAARNDRAYGVILLCAGGAIRPRAACRVKWDDVQDNYVRTWAKGHERRNPLAAWAAKELARLRPKEYKKKPVFDAVVEVAHACVQRLRRLAKLPPSVTLQALRRTAAYRLSRQVDPMVYAHVMDHTLKVAQEHYLNFDAYDASAAVNKAWQYASPLQKGLHRKRKPKRRKAM